MECAKGKQSVLHREKKLVRIANPKVFVNFVSNVPISERVDFYMQCAL